MSLSVNNSVSAQYALNSLNKSTNAMNDSIGKISSGQRINRAADDASGMVMRPIPWEVKPGGWGR